MRWYVGAALLLIVALIFDLGLLVYAMYVLLGVMLLSRYLAKVWIDSLTATRECHQLTAEIGDKVAVVIKVFNKGPLPIAWVLAEDSLPREVLLSRPPRLEVVGRRLAISMLAKGGQKPLLYHLRFLMRGYYQIGPLVLETGDLFGLHRRYRVATEPHFILVYPRVIPLTSYNISSRRPIGEIRMSNRIYEDPTRIAGVRQYQAGDSLNRVHWGATARTGLLHSKIYEPSTVAGATILLNFHRESFPSRNEPLRSELAVTAAASLANAVYHLGQQVGLVTNGRDAVDRIRTEGWQHDHRTRRAAQSTAESLTTSDRLRPLIVETRRGADQLRRILETLARVELTDGLTFAQLILEASGRIPRDATVIAILAEATPETALALSMLRRRGFAVSVVLIMFDDYELATHAGRLMAENIEVRTVRDEAALAQVCEQQLTRA